MQYMGGKTRMAKQIAQYLSPSLAGGGELLYKPILW